MPQQIRQFGLDPDRVGAWPGVTLALRRRLGGRFAVDPFGLDPQLADFVSPLITGTVRVEVEGGEHLPRTGGAAIVMNRGLGMLEPTAVAVAVKEATGRRLRVTGATDLPVFGTVLRRFGAVATSPEDIGALLRAGHIVAVPLGATWFRSGAGMPPLSLMQAMMGYPVHPVAVRAGSVLGVPTGLARWRVRIAAAVPLDDSYPAGDPLGAAELGEEVRAGVEALLDDRADTAEDRRTAGLLG